MSKFLSNNLSSLKAYVPGEQPQDKKYIKLNTNESPYPTSQGIVDAVNSQKVKDLRLYCDPECKLLKGELAKVYVSKYANDSTGEFIAECFANASLCSKPSPYSVEVLKLLREYFGK